MKTFFVICVTLICTLFLTQDASSQAPANVFYDQVDGTFKQEGGDQTLTIKRYNKTDDIGNSSQGILVTVSNTPTPLYCVMTSGNQPNRYVVEVNKTMEFVYTSQNSLELRMPGVSVKFSRLNPTTQPVALNLAYEVLSTDYFKVDGNDEIKKQLIQTPEVLSSEIKFSFSKNSNITWWKGIKVFDKDNKELCILHMEDQENGPKSKEFNSSNFGEDIKIEFWKAKAFGAHTHVTTKHFRLSELKGKEIALTWLND